MPRRIACLIAAITMAAVVNHSAAESAESSLFDESTVLPVELTGPLRDVIRDRRKRRERDFTLLADGVRHDIRVRLRGRSRVRLCDFPPLRFEFDEYTSDGSLFAGQRKLRLVTHCGNTENLRAAVLREYAAYRILNLLTKISYRVRLLRITYHDTDEKSRIRGLGEPRYAFLVESTEQLADRLSATPVDVEGVTLSSLNDRHEALVYLFHYLIGNVDWSLVTSDNEDFCCHNGDVYDLGDWRYVIPYDFDLANLVDADYRRRRSALTVRRFSGRRYRGYCTSRIALEHALDTIRSQRQSILDVVRDLPGLDEKRRAESTAYLEEFFIEADQETELLDGFERQCK